MDAGDRGDARIRQFSPSELLAFCFAFDVPIGWFVMPPMGDEAEALEMPKHTTGIGWGSVFRRTTPTEANVDAYLDLQGDWVARARDVDPRPPFHERPGQMAGGGQVLDQDELQTYFLLGLLRRGLGGSSDLRRSTSWGEAEWFADASGVLQRVADAFAAIGVRGPSPRHVMRRKDAEDSARIWDEIRRKRAEADQPICGECFHPITQAANGEPGTWVHTDEHLVPFKHDVVPIL